MNNQNALAGYFTADVNAKINTLSQKDMEEALRDLESTHYFTAILKYAQDRSGVARDGMYSIDPIKEPAQICRLQGMISGIYDIIEAVVHLKAASNEKK